MTLLISALGVVANIGTVGTNVTAIEYGNSYAHTTVLTPSSVAITIGNNASLATGSLIYTLPAGAIIVESAYLSVGLTLTTGTPKTDTPQIGIGTTVGTGANATLATTTANIITGAAMADINGTAKVITQIPTANVPFVIAAGAAHTLYLNFACAWSAVTSTAATATGTIVINWRFLA